MDKVSGESGDDDSYIRLPVTSCGGDSHEQLKSSIEASAKDISMIKSVDR